MAMQISSHPRWRNKVVLLNHIFSKECKLLFTDGLDGSWMLNNNNNNHLYQIEHSIISFCMWYSWLIIFYLNKIFRGRACLGIPEFSSLKVGEHHTQTFPLILSISVNILVIGHPSIGLDERYNHNLVFYFVFCFHSIYILMQYATFDIGPLVVSSCSYNLSFAFSLLRLPTSKFEMPHKVLSISDCRFF